MKRSYFIIFYLLISGSLLAQKDNVVGELHTIFSENLEEERTIQIYLPEGYGETDKTYSTLYILDGQWYFLNGVAIQQTLRGELLLPEMIVVGINMQPGRGETLNEKWNEFILFLESEVVPYVDNAFRTKNERILFGWESNAFLACELILKKDSEFDAAIASNGAYINELTLTSFDSLGVNKYLYLANTQKDIYTVPASDRVAELLKKVDPQNLTWEYRQFNDEIHESTAYLSIYHGLKYYYHNFRSLAFSSVEEFFDVGGIPYIEEYFQKRGKRFGLPPEIDQGTKNTLIWMAWRSDKFEAFDLFMTEFEDVLSTPRYASAYWQNRLAQFYLKYKCYDKAINFFERGIQEYQDEKYLAEMHSGLGSAYLEKGDKKQAIRCLKEAVEIAEVQNDPKLELYKNKLKAL